MDDVVIRTEKLTKTYPAGSSRSTSSTSTCGPVRSSACSDPTEPARPPRPGCYDTCHPDRWAALVGGVDVVAHPTAAKQLIGVVPQTNTLDRSLDVYENLYFHGRFFGMSAKTAKAEAHRLLEQFRLTDRARVPCSRSRGAWRSGS